MAKKSAAPTDDEPICCTPKALPVRLQKTAAACAVANNPNNAPPLGVATAMLALGADTPVPTPGHLAVLIANYWGSGGVGLYVAFMEPVDPALADRILSHMNAWADYCNVGFELKSDPNQAHVRITLAGDGYWSYVGTQILSIPRSQPTMCLQDFSMDTPESEYRRVVRHEVGHTLGFPHEHMRAELVAMLDPRKTIAYFEQNQGWDEATVRAQVLTPLSKRSIYGTPRADGSSIMSYSLPASIMKRGKPAIPGGTDIDPVDQAFAARIYPKPRSAPAPVVMPPAE